MFSFTHYLSHNHLIEYQYKLGHLIPPLVLVSHESSYINRLSSGWKYAEMDADEIELMKKMGIPCTFDSTKGKPVPGADVSGVRSVTKRLPRQYMNRRGGFNRPLPAERNR
ncbi:unnamed protein product, partial [Vitis vinifera]